MIKCILTLQFLAFTTILFGQPNYIEQSYRKYSIKSDTSFYKIDYKQVNNYLAHTMNPNEIASSVRKGTIWINDNKFLKSDTLFSSSEKMYHSKIEYSKDYLYAIPYGKDKIDNVSRLELQNYLITTLNYSPLQVLKYLNDNTQEYRLRNESSKSIEFVTQIGEYRVTIEIDKANYEIKKISTLSFKEEDDQFYGFGDVLDNYFYEDNIKLDNHIVPSLIVKDELNGKLSDTVAIHSVNIVTRKEELIKPPSGFKILNDTTEEPNITVEQYSENIYFINLHHCGTRSLAVEFEDFFLVAEAPLNSKYGRQLIEEVSKINSTKPIKYFVFGHFHPHYTGGIRPFIHKESKILCLDQNQDYINSIVESKHTIQPDSLALDPKEVSFESIFQAKTISDGSYYMTIHHIGKKSNHTNDYLIYYFPEEKLIFEGDLVWINDKTTKDNISELTSGLYQAVMDLNLDVYEVAQNWSVFDKSDKMIFKFSDIEKLCR